MVVYLYTVVAFNFFRKFYNKSEDDDEPDMKCDDMMTVSTHQPWSQGLFGRDEPQAWLAKQTAVAFEQKRLGVICPKEGSVLGDGGDGNGCHHTHRGRQGVPAFLSLWDED